MASGSGRARIVEQAEKYVKAGKLKEAVAEYEKLVDAQTPDIGISNIVGDLYARLDQTDKAVKAFQDVAAEYEKKGLNSQALAIYKKITKLRPSNIDFTTKLAELFSVQGFVSDAKREYGKVADELLKSQKPLDAIQIYEKIIRLDADDLEAKRILVDLYKGSDLADAAVEMLNDIAAARIEKGQLEDAEGLLSEARDLKPSYPRTLAGLVTIYKNRNEKDRALRLVEDSLKEDEDNIPVLNLLGNLYFEDGQFDKAEKVFSGIVETHPMDVKARIKLGRIRIGKDNLDGAYELFEPLVNNLLKKQKEEKAVGLLGLILAGPMIHLPALEKLASIYRAGKDPRKLEIADRVILDEYRKTHQKEKMLEILTELVKIRPEDGDLVKETKALRKEMGLPEEVESAPSSPVLYDNDREVIRESVKKADVYLQQGLVKNARRMLENLKLKYGDDPQILQKLAIIGQVQMEISEEEIRLRVEKAHAMESGIVETRKMEKKEPAKESPKKTVSFFPGEDEDGPKMSTADIFAETDIIPVIEFDASQVIYYDLSGQADDEIRFLQTVFRQQAKGVTAQLEKELTSIVSDFKKGLSETLKADDYDIHYQLGIAFMEQGLYGEAIEELVLASKDRAHSLECFNLISYCWRQKKSYSDAEKWLKKALNLAREGTEQYFALLYDFAGLTRESGDPERALSLYKEIFGWNPRYRDVTAKISGIEEAS